MFEGLIMPDDWLVAVAKSGRLLTTSGQLLDFLEPWHSVAKYVDEIFLCLQTNRPLLEAIETDLLFRLLSKAQKKVNL